ncbi:MAG: single-stranded DNA-binding protein [Bacteroidota bacterium]
MNSMNNAVQLIGNLGRPVKLHEMSNGRKMAFIKLATREVFHTREGGKRIETTWHNVVAWDKVAETMHVLLKKGSTVVVQGKLRNRLKGEEGKKQLHTEVVVKEFRLMNHATTAATDEVLAV